MIHKYGGSSVADTGKLKLVAENIARHRKDGHSIVCVVSAMGDQTDELTATALQLSSTPPQREMDMLLTAGERITMALLSITLNEMQIPTTSLTGSQSGILTDNQHGNAKLKKITGERIRSGLAQNKVIIVAGFQGVCPETKEITTLGRGGSDLSAVALAYSLQADYCLVYKDVDGICSAHPSLVEKTQVNKYISFAELCSLTYFGSQVIHYRAARLAQLTNTQISIRPTMNPKSHGTLVSCQNIEYSRVIGISHQKSLAMIHIPGNSNELKSVLDFIWSQGQQPTFCSQHDDKISITIPTDLYSSIQRTFPLSSKENICLGSVSIVGTGFLQEPEIVSRFTKTLPNIVVWVGTSDNHATAVVREESVDDSVARVHNEFFHS